MDNGEMEHAQAKHLERVAWFGFSSEGQHYRMAGLNLLAAIVIYWNTPILTKRSDSENTLA